MSGSAVMQWLRWQMPYAMSCYAYFPVTLTKRVLLKREAADIELDPMIRRFWNKWGVLPQCLRDMASATNPIWFSMVSGGELVMSQPLLKRLGADRGPFIFSTESFDGFGLLCRIYPQERVLFSPWDTWLPVRRTLSQLRPKAFVSVQNAYCPILLRQARRANIKTILVNGLLSRNVQYRYYLMERALALGFYRELDALSVQGEEDYEAFRKLGVPSERLTITGDIAADLGALRLTPSERLQWRRSLGLKASDPVLIVGSAHPGEQQVMMEAFLALRRHVPEARFIVVPRLVHEARAMAAWLAQRQFRVVLKTALAPEKSGGQPEYDVLVLDTLGELRTVYGVGDVAFIGSSLVPLNARGGGHNPLEPLTHGVVPLFGPHMNLWRAVATELLSVWPGLEVRSPEALGEQAALVLSGHAPVTAIRQAGVRLVDRSGGAVERTAAFIQRHVGLTEPAVAVSQEPVAAGFGV